MESYVIQYRQSTSTLSERIYHVLPMYYGKLHIGVWVKLFLVKMTFVHADVSSLIHQKQYEVVGKKLILG